jgi:hypothetical protein
LQGLAALVLPYPGQVASPCQAYTFQHLKQTLRHWAGPYPNLSGLHWKLRSLMNTSEPQWCHSDSPAAYDYWKVYQVVLTVSFLVGPCQFFQPFVLPMLTALCCLSGKKIRMVKSKYNSIITTFLEWKKQIFTNACKKLQL